MTRVTYFPQLAQFPITKRRSVRTVVNESMDGTQFKARGVTSSSLQWQLSLAALNTTERDQVLALWSECRGGAIPFVFIDPTANLFLWSDDFGKQVWIKGAGLEASGTSLVNSGASTERITQVLAAPAWFRYCMSFRIRGYSPMPLSALRLSDGVESRTQFGVGTDWESLAFSSAGEAPAEGVAFGVEIPPGAAVEIVEMQVEAQTGSSTYKRTTTINGIHRAARFDAEELEVSEDGTDSSSMTVHITAREA
ncbi:MAG: hypothetical protein IT160_20765 [Bryobacterales bacterium]|nr:hypothetical protein [Bryobacterales bacterium]